MSGQLNIFTGHPDVEQPFPPFARGSKTSRAAAAAQVPHLGRLQRAYLAALTERGGLTDHEAAFILRRPLSSINARRNELLALRLVRDSGKTRMSPFGKAASVWESVNTGGK